MRRKAGFSLVEVLLSLGIFSVALLIVFGILTPFLSQSGDVVESSTINRITDRIVDEVEQLDFSEVLAILQRNTGLYASRSGDRLALTSDPQLDSLFPETERFYAISLTRNEDLSPLSKDSSAGFIAFQITVERVIHSPDGSLIHSPLDRTLAVFNTAVARVEL